MTEQLRIAHFTNTYHPVISGVVRSLTMFRQSLIDLGHLVFIFAQDAGNYQDEEAFIFRYPALELPAMHDFPLAIPVSMFIDKVLPILKPDVIHAHHPFLLGHSGARRAEDLNIPLVFTFHTRYREYSHYIPIDQEFVKRQIDQIISDYMRRCQHIVVPSESMRSLLAADYGVTECVTVIPTGIDLAPYQQAEGREIRLKHGWGQDKVLISIGRMAKEKNWQTLLAAVIEVMHKRADVRLILIGEGDERPALQQQVERAGLSDRIEFAGQIPFADVPRYLKAADLFCFASVTETQGLVTMEALAAGLPVVAVNASGTRDVIEHEREGLLMPNDSRALAQAIEQLLSDEDRYQRFRAAAGQKAKSFDSLEQTKKLITVYQQARADKKAGVSVQVERFKPMFELVKDRWNKLPGF